MRACFGSGSPRRGKRQAAGCWHFPDTGGRGRKFIPAAGPDHGLAVCGNILNREFHAERPGEKRVSDITCLRTREGRVYLTVIPGLFDRKVTGRALSSDMEAVNTAAAALLMAFANRKAPAGLLFHSDRGCNTAPGLSSMRCAASASRSAGDREARATAGIMPARRVFSRRSRANPERRGQAYGG